MVFCQCLTLVLWWLQVRIRQQGDQIVPNRWRI
ncbi:rCG52447 [Rattus norvegicus]|uniref:RCG52447 n=1 Tax=Rattus norvegicus TaxID=10116 RepID=A6K0X1_RAT|nr:rCG52447 [Rattus norvegicus]